MNTKPPRCSQRNQGQAGCRLEATMNLNSSAGITGKGQEENLGTVSGDTPVSCVAPDSRHRRQELQGSREVL